MNELIKKAFGEIEKGKFSFSMPRVWSTIFLLSTLCGLVLKWCGITTIESMDIATMIAAVTVFLGTYTYRRGQQ